MVVDRGIICCGLNSSSTREAQPQRYSHPQKAASSVTFNQHVGFDNSQENFNDIFNVKHFRVTETPSNVAQPACKHCVPCRSHPIRLARRLGSCSRTLWSQ